MKMTIRDKVDAILCLGWFACCVAVVVLIRRLS